MKKKRNKKSYCAVGTLILAAALCLLPIKAEAACSNWAFRDIVTSECRTPICHTGDRTNFVTRRYQRVCVVGCTSRVEYRTETNAEGCCPHK